MNDYLAVETGGYICTNKYHELQLIVYRMLLANDGSSIIMNQSYTIYCCP